jgi:hypothetical protein
MSSTASGKLAEEELILCSARTAMGPRAAEKIRSLIGRGLDWSYVIDVSHRHGVSVLLYRNLTTLGRNGAPEWVIQQLQDNFLRNLARNLRLEAELATLLDRFHKDGIPAIPYKGPALARSAYGDLALRVFGDLDVLVRKQDIEKAVALMISLGYQPQFLFDSRQMAAHVRTFYELPFKSAGKAPVEMHWEIYADHFVFPIAPLSVWKDKTEDRWEPGHQSISPEKLLLILCVHGTQHYWERLGWICDIAELLRRSGDIDWSGLSRIAAETGGLRMLFLGLSLAHELLDAPIPNEILHHIGKDRVVGGLVKLIRHRLFKGSDNPPGVLQTCLFYIRIRERFRDKARFCFRTLSRPIPGEWDRLALDGSCDRLTNVIRHVFLGFSYGLGLTRQRYKEVVGKTEHQEIGLVNGRLRVYAPKLPSRLRNGTKVR